MSENCTNATDAGTGKRDATGANASRLARLTRWIPAPSAGGVFVAALGMKFLLGAVLMTPDVAEWARRFDDRFDLVKQYDDVGYFTLAKGMADEGAFLWRSSEGVSRTVYRTPGYPFVLAGIGLVSGWRPVVMLLLQVLLLSLIPVLFLLLLKKENLRGEVAWLMALDPLTNIVSLTFMTEGWLVFVVLLSLLCAREGQERPSHRIYAFLLWSVATLVKPSVQYFYLVLGVLGLVFWKGRGKTVAALLVGSLPLVVWGIRNHDITGRWELSTQIDGSIVLVAAIEEREGRGTFQEFADRHAPQGRFYEVIMDNNLDYVGEVREYVRRHPLLFLKHHLAGDLYLLFGTARNHVKETLRGGRDWTRAGAATYDGLMVCYYLLMYVFLAIVLWQSRLAWRKSLFFTSVTFILYVLAIIGAMSFYTGGGLKRVPMVPFLLLLMSFGVASYGKGTVREESSP